MIGYYFEATTRDEIHLDHKKKLVIIFTILDTSTI